MREQDCGKIAHLFFRIFPMHAYNQFIRWRLSPLFYTFLFLVILIYWILQMYFPLWPRWGKILQIWSKWAKVATLAFNSSKDFFLQLILTPFHTNFSSISMKVLRWDMLVIYHFITVICQSALHIVSNSYDAVNNSRMRRRLSKSALMFHPASNAVLAAGCHILRNIHSPEF